MLTLILMVFAFVLFVLAVELAVWAVYGTLWLIFAGIPRALMATPRFAAGPLAGIRRRYDARRAL